MFVWFPAASSGNRLGLPGIGGLLLFGILLKRFGLLSQSLFAGTGWLQLFHIGFQSFILSLFCKDSECGLS